MVPRLQRYNGGAPTPLCPLGLDCLGFRFLRVLGTCFDSNGRPQGQPSDLVRVTAGPTRLCSPRRRQRGLPGSWTALVCVLRSLTPAGPPGPTLSALRYCLPQSSQRRLPQLTFRGSITQPTHFLCTLHLRVTPRVQHSVPVGGQPYRVGLIPTGLLRGLPISTSWFPPPRLGLAHDESSVPSMSRFSLLGRGLWR